MKTLKYLIFTRIRLFQNLFHSQFPSFRCTIMKSSHNNKFNFQINLWKDTTFPSLNLTKAPYLNLYRRISIKVLIRFYETSISILNTLYLFQGSRKFDIPTIFETLRNSRIYVGMMIETTLSDRFLKKLEFL